jgi:ech hydrogenase subunit D
MENKQITKELNHSEVLGLVFELHRGNYRLVQISCTKIQNGYEIIYSFDKNYNMLNLKVTIAEIDEILSITSVYPYAFLYENEMKDLFGVHIDNINVDFEGNLYKLPVKTPFKQ